MLLTRRTIRRHYLLRPDDKMSNLYLYAIAYLANKYGLEVHALALMSDHKHEVVTDVYGQRPLFLAELHRILALGTKVLRKWEGAVWDSRETSVVELDTPETILRSIGYTVTNPSAAGAVELPEQWPGVCMTVNKSGVRTMRVRRPEFFFDPRNAQWPEEIELAITPPKALVSEFGSVESACAAISAEVEKQVGEAVEAMRSRKRAFLGPARVRKLSPYKRATKPEPIRERNPTVAPGGRSPEDLIALIEKVRAFRRAYRQALDAWRRGNRNVEFPYGTWLMVVFHGARAAPLAE